jgi:hypothetical protein
VNVPGAGTYTAGVAFANIVDMNAVKSIVIKFEEANK